MATLAQDLYISLWGPAETEKWILDSSAAQVVYKGMAMIIDASADTLYARIADGVTCVDNDVFLGVAAGGIEIALGDPEDTLHQVELYTNGAIVGFQSTALTNADVGKTIYASAYTASGITLSASNGAYPPLGVLRRVEDGFAYIELATPVLLDVP